MPGNSTIRIDGISQPIEIVRSNRKTLGIHIDREGHVSVRAPFAASDKDVSEILISKKKWLIENIRRSIEAKIYNNVFRIFILIMQIKAKSL